MGNRGKGTAVVGFAALIAALVLVAPGSGAAASCASGETEQTLEVGVVKAEGCFSSTTDGDTTTYTATSDVDLNGLIIKIDGNAVLKITDSTDETKWRVQSAKRTPGDVDGKINIAVGDPSDKNAQFSTGAFDLDFRPTATGPFTIGEYFLSNSALNSIFGGFSPAQLQSEFVLDEDGKGKFSVIFKLTGPFALKGKPQAVSVDFDTEVGEPVKFDGFDIELKQMDFFPPVNLEEATLKYSRAEDEFEADANVQLPLFGGKGFGGGFTVKDGKLDAVEVSATGLKVPIGEVAFLESIAGSIGDADGTGKDLDVKVDAGITIGPEIDLPRIGEVDAAKFDGGIEINGSQKSGFFALTGDLALVRIKVARFGLKIYFSGAIAFDAGIGIGIPSFTNDRRQPFYIGAGVDGWFDHSKFSVEGNGEFKLFNVDLLKGNALVSDKAYGACWKVLGIPGGAVYPRTVGKILTFPVGVCGLGRYKEQQARGAAAAVADGAVTLAARHGIVRVQGDGGAPRFVMRSDDGREYTTPADDEEDGLRSDHAFFLDEEGEQTVVVLEDGAGTWTFEELDGSPPISGVQRNEPAPEPRVAAHVRGRGAERRLVWKSRSAGFQNQRLEFVERMPGGRKVVIARTHRASGSRRIRLHQGGHYGKRELEVLVVHRHTPVMEKVLDTYRVGRPDRPDRARGLRAFRDGGRTVVSWGRARGARQYLVRARSRGSRTPFTKIVGGGRRSLQFPDVPGRRPVIITVRGINRDGQLGPRRRTLIRTDAAVGSLKGAARRAVRSAQVRPTGTVRVHAHCPEGGHCDFVLVLRRPSGKVLDRIRFQAAPDTRSRHTLFPPDRLRDRLRRGDRVRLQVRARASRGELSPAELGPVSGP